MKKLEMILLILTVFAMAGVLAIPANAQVDEDGEADWGDPTSVKEERDVYFPNTEALGANEMRVIACGTGMPTARESQAAACFLVELGNGDKFIFDLGTGSHARLASLDIPYDYLNKVFLSHLHSDHFGDFAALYIGGWVGGRMTPFKVWGPSGKDVVSAVVKINKEGTYDGGLVNQECTPDNLPEGATNCDYLYGTRYSLEKWRQALTWDLASRSGTFPSMGGDLLITEFDFDGEEGDGAAYHDAEGNPLFPKKPTRIYFDDVNGNGIQNREDVVVTAWPAVHAIDGPVSFRLEWNDLSFVFGGDTYPNRWFTEYASGADLVVHECFLTPKLLVQKYGFDAGQAISVGTQVHTSPEAFGYIMKGLKEPPGIAIAYHFFNDFDTTGELYELIRKNYDGPLSMADDMMVWNVRKTDDGGKEFKIRLVVADEDVWPPDASPESTGDTEAFPKSPWLVNGKWHRPPWEEPENYPLDNRPPVRPVQPPPTNR